MRLIPGLLIVVLAMPAMAQTPECERLTAKIKAQQEQVFRLNVAAASQSIPRGNAESVDTRLQTLALVTAIQSNVQIAIAAKCDVGSIVIDHEPDGANAAQCGSKIKAAQNNKANLAAAYRLPACGGLFEEQAKAAEAEAARIAAQPKPPPRPRPGVDQEDWRRRVEAWTARRAQCRAAHPDNEAMVAQCAGPIPEPRR
jgi:hypothetical protein